MRLYFSIVTQIPHWPGSRKLLAAALCCLTLCTTSPRALAQGGVVNGLTQASASVNGVTVTVPIASATVTVCSVATIGTATQSGSTVTINTTATHGFTMGQSVKISGVSVAGYNGTFSVASTPTATSFTYSTTAGLGNATGGAAAPNNTPCTPLATLYSDQTLTTAVSNPTTSDASGNYTLYAAPGYYLAQFSGNGLQTYSQTLQVPVAPQGTPGIQYVDGVTNTTVQGAINKLNGLGGVVYVPCGTFAGPTSIPSFTHLISLCKASPAGPALIGNTNGIVGNFASKSYAPATSLNSTILTYSSTVTPISKAFGVELRGITFDFGGNNAGLIISGSTGGVFDFTVQNCAGSLNVTPCLQVLSVFNNANDYFNTAENDFQRVSIETVPYGGSPGGTGIHIAGTGPLETSAVTNNYWRSVRVSNVKTGIEFAGNDDSNDFGHVYVGVNVLGGVGNAVAVNCANNVDQGDSGEHFEFLETDYTPGGATTGAAICLGAVTGFTVDNFELGGGWDTAHELATSGTSSYWIKKHYDIPGGHPENGRILTTGSFTFVNDGNATLSASPRATWNTFIPTVSNVTGQVASFWIADKAITITRLTVFLTGGTNSVGCSPNTTFFVRDATAATSSAVLTLANAINNADSGGISFSVAAGHQLQLQYTATGCSTQPTNANVVVEYRMQ